MEAATGLERRVRVQVPAARVELEVETRLKAAGTTVRLKGFRPGKVPAAVIRQRFGPQIRSEVVQDAVQSGYSEAIERENLRPAVAPRIEMAQQEPGLDLVFTAVFEVYPEFEVAGVDTLAIDRPDVTVSDADIDQTIERLRVQRSTWVPVDRAAADGDRVVVDFEGSRDGVPLEGAKAAKLGIILGEARMVPGFEGHLAGLRAGSDRTFTVRFPDDYYEASLRGADVDFAVHVHEVTERVLPVLDAEFIRGFDVPAEDPTEFRRLVRENLEREAAAKVQAEMRRQVMESLLAANPVEVPAGLVEREAASLQTEAMRKLGIKDVAQAEPVSAYEDVARRRVRLGLVLGAVIQQQGLKIDPVRVDQKLDELCRPYERPDEVRQLYLQNPTLMGQIENSIMEEQVMTLLTERARVTPRPVAFAELMGA